MKFKLTGGITVLGLYFGIGVTPAADMTGQMPPVISAPESVASQSVDHKQALERSLQAFDEKLLHQLEETQQARQDSARQKAALQNSAESEHQSDRQAEGKAASAEGSESGAQSNQTAGLSGQDNHQQTGAAERSMQTPGRAAAQAAPDGQAQDRRANTQVVDMPSGNDDDIIARQLREAAQAETDPQVKERLWQEYRKYQQQQNTGA